METKLLELIACPVCQGRLLFNKETNQLICQLDKLAYPIKQGIPVLLAEQAEAYGCEKE